MAIPMRIVSLVAVVLLAPLRLGAAPTSAELYACATRSTLAGSCFSVHGRLNAGNGSPSCRLCPVGTRRLLGVECDLHVDMPDSIARQIVWPREMFADFVVCPLTREKPGVMQRVCIESAQHVVVR